MSLDEFNEMITNAGVVSDTFGSREISPLFNLSMMTQKNELDFDRHYNMIHVEMIEAIARVADKLQNLNDYWPEMPCFNKHQLDKKIESLMMIMLSNCLPKPQAENMEKQLKKAYDEELNDPIKKKYWAHLHKYPYP